MNKIIKGANLSEDGFVGDTFKSNLNLNMGGSLFSDSVLSEAPETSFLDAHGSDKLELPSTDFVTDAQIQQTGMDLHLVLPDGSSVVIVGYFAEAVQPELVSPSGASLTPSLVESFKTPDPSMMKLAQAGDGIIDGAAGDPIGNLEIMSGEVFAVRTDGSRVQLQLGDPVYQGDQIETGADGSVKIKFVDETIFTLGEDARLALDELVFDPSATSGSSAFSILKGSFVFVSGQIAHDNYDNMEVTTPVATIGIRGTTVTGSVLIGDTAFTFSVLEGSIAISAGGETLTLSESFATAIGNLSPSGRIEIAQSATDQAAVMRGNHKALNALGDADLKKLEQTIEKEIEEQTGEKVDLDLKAEIAAAAEEPEPEPEPNEGEGNPDGPPGEGVNSAEEAAALEAAAAAQAAADAAAAAAAEEEAAAQAAAEAEAEAEAAAQAAAEAEAQAQAEAEAAQAEAEAAAAQAAADQAAAQAAAQAASDAAALAAAEAARLAAEEAARLAAEEAARLAALGGTINGTSGNDTLLGTSGADTLIISGGMDDLDGGDGSDTIDFVNKGTVSLTMSSATSGSYSLVDGSGTFSNIETVIGSGQIDNLTGNIGNDVFYGMDSNDYLYGLSGDDTLYGGNGNDNLVGGTGGDTLQGDAGDDTINGGDGVDSIDGGAGTGDTITFSGATGSVNASFSATTGAGTITDDGFGNTETFSNIEILSGSSNDDTLSAAAATSGVTLVGNLGNDTITGGAGNDTLHDGGGNDTVNGGAGDDTIVSDSGADNYHGDAGTDTLDITGASNAITLDATAGTFTVSGSADVNNFTGFETFKGSAYADSLTGDTGNETLYGEAGNDTLTGGSGDDTLDGGAGDDSFVYEAGTDSYIGGLGTDTLNLTAAGAGADINLTTGSITVSGETDTITGIETIYGSYQADTFVGDANDNIFSGLNGNEIIDGGAGNDNLTGGDNDDTIDGGSGDDFLYGGAHADTLDGGTGNDTVNGEADDDNIYGSAGTDTIDGGTGTDTLQYINATSGVIITYGITDGSGRVITDGFGTVGSDTFANIESIRGSSHNDILNGSANADFYYGSLGDDIIHGEAGADTLDGEDGNDIIFGGTGNDTIVGGIGDDIIDGGSGVDNLSGGTGTDILSYATATGGVTIDVAAGQATDDGYGNIDTISGFETYLGSNFDDIFYTATSASASTENFDGGFGFDYLKYSNIASANVTITMSGQGSGTTNDDGYGTTDTFNGIDAFYGTQATGGDTFNGNIGDDIFSGLNGTDIINGGAGQDYLYGGGDNDTVNGGDGDDYLEGNAGADTINGDAGDDIINGGDGIDVIDGGAGTDTLKNDNAIALIFTGAGAGTFSDDGYGNAESFVNIERIDGSAGGDTITGHDGNDYFIGNDGVDSLTGNNGNDSLFGGNGNDVINGGADNDFIQGGAGADSITLGTGTDTLYMHTATDSDASNTGDVVSDFDFSADIIKFNTDIVTGDLTTGNFFDAGTGANFSLDDGKAKFYFDTGSKVAQFDLNGDGTEDMKITLTNATSFSVSNVGLHDVANVRDGLSFDGVNDYVALDDAAINNMTTGTISAWINLNKIGDGSAGSGAAISSAQLDFHSTNALFGVGLNNGVNFTASAGQIVFNGKNTEAYALSNGTISADSWHHVAVTFSATSASIYIDGVLDNTVAGDFSIQSIPSTYTPNPPGNVTYTLETTIGRVNSTGGSSADYELDGSMDDYAVWDTELTAAEISDYYNTGTSSADGSMRMHHTFDNQSAQDQLNNYDGTIFGAPTGITYDETYIEGHAGAQIYQDENIQLADSANLESATFTITNFVAGDVLSATTFGSVIASYNHLNGVLKLTGYTNIADYEATIKSITFESPAAPFNATTRTITGVISDGQYSENLNDVNLEMTENSDPVANADSFTVAAGGSVSNFDFLSNDTDANSDILIVSNIIASDGTFIDNGDGTLNYTANNHTGTETISYTITDGVSESQGVITVTVT